MLATRDPRSAAALPDCPVVSLHNRCPHHIRGTRAAAEVAAPEPETTKRAGRPVGETDQILARPLPIVGLRLSAVPGLVPDHTYKYCRMLPYSGHILVCGSPTQSDRLGPALTQERKHEFPRTADAPAQCRCHLSCSVPPFP